MPEQRAERHERSRLRAPFYQAKKHDAGMLAMVINEIDA